MNMGGTGARLARVALLPVVRAALGLTTLLAGVHASAAPPTAIATFESIGLYWQPDAGSAGPACTVRYRAVGAASWRDGLPLWLDARDGEYRGSLVQLQPGSSYEIELSIAGGATETLTARTWSEDFPVAQVIELPTTSSETLVVDQSGTAEGYILYTAAPGDTATIDVSDAADSCVSVDAAYVILRGLTLRGASVHAIRLYGGSHDVVIEESDISGWGRIEADGWGVDYDSAIYSNSDIERVVVQRNRMHHPRSDSNDWTELRTDYGSYHPRGPQAVTFFNSLGNHVIRYNEIYSDDAHRFNDGLGAGSNFSYEGFPNRDSDIYGNLISHCWDDGIESEGANQQVRIWGNYIDRTYVKIATASTSLGPLYVWRNVAAQSRVTDSGASPDTEPDPEHWDNVERGGFLKTSANDPSGGRIYVLHNTVLQPPGLAGETYPRGVSVGLGHGGAMSNTVSRNNILQSCKSWHDSIYDRDSDPQGDYDYDLYNGHIHARDGSEANGIQGEPEYDSQNGPGELALAASSPGYDDGERLPGFNDGYTGAGPDMGAHEAATPALQFGVDAYRTRPPLPDAGADAAQNPDAALPLDAAEPDIAAADAAVPDAVSADALAGDAAAPDAAVSDAVSADALAGDAAVPDAAAPDAVSADALAGDAAAPDAALGDRGLAHADAAVAADARQSADELGAPGGCRCSAGDARSAIVLPCLLLLGLARARRRR